MNFSGTIGSDFMKLANIPLLKRPSLIDFAATDFFTLRNSLIKYMKAVYPTEYQYFVESDLGMMFVEVVAYMGAVMSMKADMLANENFLVTARQRLSVKKLLELVGVRMRGPLSAAANGQITFDISPDNAEESYIISPAERTVEVTSPQDGGALTYTLYKVVNGVAQAAQSTGQIVLYSSESDNMDSGRTVYSNLALQEGVFVTDAGEFAATEGIKTIPLTQAPVVDGSIEVFVNSVNTDVSGAYKEVPNIFYASGLLDRVFEVVYDNDYGANIVFGDGTVGISPDDTASYFVSYRIGGGSRGNIAKHAINVGIAGTSNTTINGALTNTSVAVGGANAETIEHAKRWAPLTFRRQDRLVTLLDYTVFANNYISSWGTVGKAVAINRKAYSSANTIDLFVVEKASDLQVQKATTNFKRNLLAAMNEKKMATDEIIIVDGLIRTLDLIVTISIDEEQRSNRTQIINKVRGAILDFMNVDNREFGETLAIAEVNRKIFEVDEVRYAVVSNLAQDVRVDFNEIIQLNNLTINIEYLD